MIPHRPKRTVYPHAKTMAASGHLEWCQTIVGRLIRIQFSPGSFRRKFTALDLDLLMAVIAVCLAPAVHPIAADIILTALAVWTMRNGR